MTRRRVIHATQLLEKRIKRALWRHLAALGYAKAADGTLIPPSVGKDAIRQIHLAQRLERLEENKTFLAEKGDELLGFFANGEEVNPSAMKPRLELVPGESTEADIFRLATLSWSVPVSRGYGRRLRFLVWDDSNRRLIGIVALGDPPFNLHARDALVGWNSSERASRLVHMMDAYVLGAVPPYNMLLGGKLIACLVRSREVVAAFRHRYARSMGTISGKAKDARLVAVTTTSALGRSSLYSRLRLDSIRYFDPIGYTGGWGHFHVPETLFDQMRQYLALKGHSYAYGYEYGDGPNWRLRTIRAALTEMGINADVLRHGIRREVFVSMLADNALDVLRGNAKRPLYDSLGTADQIGDLAVKRWIQPRSERDTTYVNWRSVDFIEPIRTLLDGSRDAIVSADA
jgi:hypothetical protein